ncbi:hypothetical protein E4U53_001242 [Claviceps sorghi]|nr:hypothetical protein E4U53_001242 [Claviceps sorghi]
MKELKYKIEINIKYQISNPPLSPRLVHVLTLLYPQCSGERPACDRCVRKRITCHYTTNPGETKSQALKRSYWELKNQGTTQQQLLELMRDLPEQDALEILHRMRTGADPGGIVQQVKAGGVLVQMAIQPESRLRYDFPYGSEIPADDIPNNPYLKSRLYEAASLQSITQHADHPGSAGAVAAPEGAANVEYQSIYLKPFHAAETADPRLSDARCSLWTAVCSDDALMRDLLKVFFRCEYHYTAAFHKDYFLEDLIAQRRDFCSSLLVNVVLAYASACYPGFSHRAEYWNPDTPLYRFLAEAKRIWELEYSRPRITTIQAGIIIDVIHHFSGLDEVGQPYRLHAIVMAYRMRLFHRTGDEADDRIRNGKAFAAWALYNWETLNAFSFMLPPLLKKPPEWPLPDPSEDLNWYGEIWLQYPLNSNLSPSYFAHVMRSRSYFRIIMNEFCQAAYSDGHEISLETVNHLHARLREWYDNLPGPLQPSAIVLPGHLQLHAYYHHLILTMYEPLLHQDAHHEAARAHQIVDEARKYLQTLVRLYYLRHGFDAMDLFIVHPLMLLALECVETVHETTSPNQLEALRSLLILTVKGLYEQRRNHYLAKALFRVIRGRMREAEVALLKGAVHVDDDEIDAQCDLVQAVRSHLPVSLKRKNKNMDAHTLKNLVEDYVGLSIEGGDAGRDDLKPLELTAWTMHHYGDMTGAEGMNRAEERMMLSPD